MRKRAHDAWNINTSIQLFLKLRETEASMNLLNQKRSGSSVSRSWKTRAHSWYTSLMKVLSSSTSDG